MSSTEQVRWANKVDQLIALSDDEERKAFFAKHPEVCCSEVARQLGRRTGQISNEDLLVATRVGETLRQLAGRSGDALSIGYSHRALGIVCHLHGLDYELSIKHLESAIANFEAVSREDEVAITCSNGIGTLAYLGKVELLRAWENRAREYFVSQADHLRLGRLELNVGSLANWQGEWEQAAEAYRNAHRLMLLAGADQSDERTALSNLSLCYTRLGDLPQAASLIRRALEISRENGWDLNVAFDESYLARVRFLQGDFRSALQLTPIRE